MAIFVLVSGGWQAAWCWQRVTPLLAAAGHRVVAPDLVGMTDDGVDPATITLATWADQIAAIVAGEGEPVVLVGHSRGGIIISEVAERVPDRVKRLVYLTALLLSDGATAQLPRAIPRGTVILAPDGATATVRDDRIGPVFYSDTAPEWIEVARQNVRPEPVAAMTTPVRLTGARYGRVPRAYIECLRDRAVPVDLQRAMQAEQPCDPVIALDSDHAPFFSAPEALVDALIRLA